MNLLALPAFTDNYIWMVHNGRDAVVVDPGDAAPVIAALTQADLQLHGILVTHKHPDHVGGLTTLLAHPAAAQAVVYGPADEPMPVPIEKVQDGQVLSLLGTEVQVLTVPGHTLGHVAYVWQAPVTPAARELSADSAVNAGVGTDVASAWALFCGDTLFSGGCGRLFEGTPAQMAGSLARFKTLPEETWVCCAHEYTLSNLRFAKAVEPDNTDLPDFETRCRRLRDRDLPTLPSTLKQEKQINPFLRCDQPEVIASAQARGATGCDEVSVLAAIRQWKDNF